MIKRFFHNLRGRSKEQSASEQSYNPKTSAEDFIQLVVASTPYSENFGSATAYFLNFDPQEKMPEYKDRLKQKADEVLGRARITPQFRQYIVSHLLSQFQLGMAPSVEYWPEQMGIDLEKGEYGIFNPQNAKEIERTVLRGMLTHEDELSMIFATGVAGINLDEWEREFRKLHKEKPV